MPKLTTLTVNQLKDILRAHEVALTGNKAELIQRLTQTLGSDEIDSVVLNNVLGTHDNTLQTQIDELKTMMMELATTIRSDRTVQPVAADEIETESAEAYVTGSISAASEAELSADEASYVPTTAISRYAIKDIAETIPEYNPTDEASVTAEQFVEHIESVVAAYGFEQRSLLLAIYTRLRGSARSWVDGQSKIFDNWKVFKSAFLGQFGVEYDEAEIHIKMSNTVRGHDEKILDYCFRIHALGQRYRLSEAAIIKYARNGLKHRELQTAIAIMKFENMKQFGLTCKEFFFNKPAYVRQERPYGNVQRNITRPPFREPHNEIPPNNQIECFNCHRFGHISKNCPQPQRKMRCAKCQRTTHTTANCTENSNTTTTTRNVNKIAEFNDYYPDVLKEIDINGRTIKAFMDSGSSISLIRESSVRDTDDVICCHRVLSGFAGGAYIAKQKIVATIEIDGNTFSTELLVVPDLDLPEQVLLGRDILCRKGNRFVIVENNCYVENVNAITITNKLPKQFDEALSNIIKTNKHCFASDISELGSCTTEKMAIKLITDQPFVHKPYRIAFSKREIVATIVQELIDHDIVRASKSIYASPVVLIEKKNGEHRLCVDYRSLNKITIKTPFPMPVLEEQFAQLAGNRYFTSLDLRMGYHQIAMHEESIQYTAFITTEGLFEFKRMPFGLINAPAVFQRVMNTIIQEMPRGEAMAYLDDIIIPSQSIDDGLNRLERFLKIVARHGLTLRYDKCRFLQTQIEHLGHNINAEGIQPGKKKINAVQNFREPRNITDVRRFLGLTGFFRKFVPDYALITKPITRLLKKTETFTWNTEQKNAFNELIDRLTNAPVLELYDQDASHEVHTDACSIGLAGVLLQSKDSKSWRAVMYFSRHCTDLEQRFHSYELEVLAVVETLERFRIYLLGKFFRIVTDCAAIALTKESKELKPRIARWWMKLQEFNYEIIHRPANRLAHVDAMSRTPVEPAKEVEPAGFLYVLNETDWVVAMQLRDERIRFIVEVLRNCRKTSEEGQLKKYFIIQNQRLYRRVGDEIKLVVPKTICMHLIKHYHDDMGHFSTDKTLERIRKLFWFPKMRKRVKAYVASCIACCYNKFQRTKPEGELHLDTPIPIPFRVLHVDHLGPFRKSSKGNTHMFIMIDPFSKFCILKAVRNTCSTPVINALNEVIGYFGLPTRIISDRGTAFTSRLFGKFCKVNNIKHIQNAVRTPRANGQVERVNATVLNMLRTAQNQKNWDVNLHQMQWVLNSQKNQTTKCSPNELIFSFNLNDAVHNHLVAAISPETQENDDSSPDSKREGALTRIAEERAKWKIRFDQKHSTPTVYNEGDLVVIKHEAAATGESRKLEPKFKGPYIVEKSLGHDRYVLTDVPGLKLATKKFTSVYSSDNMKPWCSAYPELQHENDLSDDDDYDIGSNDETDDSSETSGRRTSGRDELSTPLETDDLDNKN